MNLIPLEKTLDIQAQKNGAYVTYQKRRSYGKTASYNRGPLVFGFLRKEKGTLKREE